MRRSFLKGNTIRIGAVMLSAAALVWAQDAPSQTSQATTPQDQDGWRRLGNAPGQYSAQPYSAQPPQTMAPGQPPAPAYQPPPPIPATLTLAPGTFFTIRVNQALSSDHNKVGDLFIASLAKPIIINGVVVAERGQTVSGRVAEVDKGGLLKGNTKLGIELTQLTLIDGSQVPVRSQLINITGPGYGARNGAIVAGTTVTGAAIGGIVGAGQGAAIGAGAGAAVGILGALATKGYPTIIRPEAVLTFRMDQPIVVATDKAPQAFRYAGPGDYEQPRMSTYGPGPAPRPYYGAGYYPGYYSPYPYYGYGYPFYPGIGVGIGFGGRWRR